MKKISYLFLPFVIALGLCSCSKTEIKPNDHVTAGLMPLHVNSLNAYTPASVINLNGSHDITISGKAINGGGIPAITLSNCYNVHITQNSLGNSTDVGIKLYNCYNITIDYNFITNSSAGVYVDTSPNGGIIVDNNQFLNINGPFPRGQFVQFNTVSGANNSISNNKCENIFGQSNPQEAFNLYKSNGTPTSPIRVNANWIRGGGPAASGGGIQLGDNGGSYEVASNNILVNPGQMGISISGGSHQSAINNTIYAKQQSFTNVGIVVWAQLGYTITNCTVSGNKVKYINHEYYENDNWLASGESTPAGWNTNIWSANVDASILPALIITLPGGVASPPPNPVPSNVVNLIGAHDMTISDLTITGGNVPCIKLTNCYNIYITRCNLKNSTNAGIELDNCTHVTIEVNNLSYLASGIVANNCPSGNISIYTNQMKNIQGPLPFGNCIKFNNVNGTGNNISYNKLENILGQSNPQNAIDLLQSYGAASSPININGNWIKGGGPNYAGGGINLGDQGGSYQIASNNILVNPGQFGMTITGGDHMSISNNSIFAIAQYFTNVGIYVWGQGGHVVTNSTVNGNKVNYKNSKNSENDDWLASGEATPSGWYTNTWGANINASILPSVITSL